MTGKLYMMLLTMLLVLTATISASVPSTSPTLAPSLVPTKQPNASPVTAPTATPTTSPTLSPTLAPTLVSTKQPSTSPVTAPTANPTLSPTLTPSLLPTKQPNASPVTAPTATPTASPTLSPTLVPTKQPNASPVTAPTANPTLSPTRSPTLLPTQQPNAVPITAPIAIPTLSPTKSPNPQPTPPIPPASNSVASGYISMVSYTDAKCTNAVTQRMIALDYCIPLPMGLFDTQSLLNIWISISFQSLTKAAVSIYLNPDCSGPPPDVRSIDIPWNLTQGCQKLPMPSNSNSNSKSPSFLSPELYQRFQLYRGSDLPPLEMQTGYVTKLYTGKAAANGCTGSGGKEAQITALNATATAVCEYSFNNYKELTCSHDYVTMQTYKNSSTCDVKALDASFSAPISQQCQPTNPLDDIFKTASPTAPPTFTPSFYGTTSCFALSSISSVQFTMVVSMGFPPDVTKPDTKAILIAAQAAVQSVFPTVPSSYFTVSFVSGATTSSSTTSYGRLLGSTTTYQSVIIVSLNAPMNYVPSTSDAENALSNAYNSGALGTAFQASLAAQVKSNYASSAVTSSQILKVSCSSENAPTSAPVQGPSGNGAKTAGIIAGAVIGVLAGISCIVDIYFFFRHRNQNKVSLAHEKWAASAPPLPNRQVVDSTGKRVTMLPETNNPLAYESSHHVHNSPMNGQLHEI